MGIVYKIRAEHYGSGLVIPIALTYDDRRLVHIRKIFRYEQNIDGSEKIQRFYCTTDGGNICLSLNNGRWSLENAQTDL